VDQSLARQLQANKKTPTSNRLFAATVAEPHFATARMPIGTMSPNWSRICSDYFVMAPPRNIGFKESSYREIRKVSLPTFQTFGIFVESSGLFILSIRRRRMMVFDKQS
jgi:hypothetical protein